MSYFPRGCVYSENVGKLAVTNLPNKSLSGSEHFSAINSFKQIMEIVFVMMCACWLESMADIDLNHILTHICIHFNVR